jgi:hypothetical protein
VKDDVLRTQIVLSQPLHREIGATCERRFGDSFVFALYVPVWIDRGIVNTLIGYLVEQKLSRSISDLESAFTPGSARLSEATFGAAPK